MVFDINEHTLRIDNVLQPLIDGFRGAPQYPLSAVPAFEGAGVYALYLIDARGTAYEGHIRSDTPIYVGKAVPAGSRQGRVAAGATNKLRSRINEHRRSIETVGLDASMFIVRFAVLEGTGLDLISALESALIRDFQPLWNSRIDGFGNHNPGSGRYEQAPSEWDILHPGRPWAERLTGTRPSLDAIHEKIRSYGEI